MTKTKKSIMLIVITGILFFGLSSYYAVSDFLSCSGNYINISFFELITGQINNLNIMLFNLAYIQLFLLNDVWVLIVKKTLSDIIIKVTIYISVFLLANFIFLLYRFGLNGVFNNSWRYSTEYSLIGLSPLQAFIISIVLYGLRIVCITYLAHLINQITKKDYWGFWAIILISLIDYTFYDFIRIKFPIYILPVEHTRILYTMARALPASYVHRFPYIISITYWITLIILIDIIISSLNKKQEEALLQ